LRLAGAARDSVQSTSLAGHTILVIEDKPLNALLIQDVRKAVGRE
jgi:hypothetical protein